MSNTNDFVPFAIGAGANVESAAAWAAQSERQLGFQMGTARSALLNTAWRQSGFVAAMIGQFCADFGPGNVQDNGNLPQLESQFEAAILALIVGSNVPTSIVGAEAISNNVLTPPASGVGNNGQYYIGQNSGNIWGPKASGAWPSTPIHFGNNRLIAMTSAMTLIVVNCLCYWDGSTPFTLTLPPPGMTGGYERICVVNNSTVSQTVLCPTGNIQGGQWPSPEASITLIAGQIVEFVSLGAAFWVPVSNSNVTFL